MIRVALVIVLLAAACGPRPSACLGRGDCGACTEGGGCAWCFETAECLDDGDVCPGDRAVTADQCEAEEAATTVDAGVTAP